MKCLRIEQRDLFSFLSCVCALFPCFFSDIMSSYGLNGRVFFYCMAFMLGFLSDFCLKVESWKIQTLLAWGVIFLLCICNRNGDLQRGAYGNVVNMFFIFAFCVLLVFRDKTFLKNFLTVMIMYLVLHLVFGFYFITNPGGLISLANKYFNLSGAFYTKFLRYINAGAFMGITSHYSTSGMYMAVAVVLLATCTFAYRDRYEKWNVPVAILFVLFLVALVLTQKRAHLLFSTAAIILMYLVGYVKGDLNKRLVQILVAVTLFVIAFLIFLNIPAFQATILRFSAGGNLDEVSTGRVSELWIPALNEFISHPLFGIGWRQFKYVHPMHNGVNNDVHNIYLQVAAENGIIAAIYIITLMIHTYILTWKMLSACKDKADYDNYFYLLFSFGYQTFFLLYGLTGNPFYEVSCLFPYFLSCCICYRYSAEHGYDRVKIRMGIGFRRTLK